MYSFLSWFKTFYGFSAITRLIHTFSHDFYRFLPHLIISKNKFGLKFKASCSQSLQILWVRSAITDHLVTSNYLHLRANCDCNQGGLSTSPSPNNGSLYALGLLSSGLVDARFKVRVTWKVFETIFKLSAQFSLEVWKYLLVIKTQYGYQLQLVCRCLYGQVLRDSYGGSPLHIFLFYQRKNKLSFFFFVYCHFTYPFNSCYIHEHDQTIKRHFFCPF